MKIFNLIGIALILFSSPVNYLDKYEKKINKELKKTFNIEGISIKEYELPDHSDFGPDNSFYLIKNKDEHIGYVNINRVNACRQGGCERPSLVSVQRYDHFYYMAVFDTEFSTLKISILDYQSEHGYEICSRSWLKQFTGNSKTKYIYNKNIDAISGATVSVNALIDEINFMNGQLVQIFDEKNQ